MPLTIKPPRRPGDPPIATTSSTAPSSNHTSSPLQRRASINNASNAVSQVEPLQPPPPGSPPRPEFSPLTPKALPAILAKLGTVQPPPENGRDNQGTAISPAQDGSTINANVMAHQQQQQQQRQHVPQMTSPEPPASEPAIPPTSFVPQPANLPFSSEDSSDAIALRAAIATLQFQRKKAQDDLRALQSIKRLAVQDPAHFRDELVAGRVKEDKTAGSGLGSLIQRAGDEGPDVVSDGEGEELDAEAGAAGQGSTTTPPVPATVPESEIPNSQPSAPSSSFTFPQPTQSQPADRPPHHQPPNPSTARPTYPPIPAPQNVARMPHINWAKYALNPVGLDQMHNQQQRWPGDERYGSGDRGREFVVAAPYDPFVDQIEQRGKQGPAEGDVRKDSRVGGGGVGVAGGGAGAAGVGAGAGAGGAGTVGGLPGSLNRTPSATGTVSEHVMETRRSSGR